jgi:hypothetical protein
MTESEWKLFRKVREVALERFCENVLTEVSKLSSKSGKSAHERYLAIYKRIRRRDRELAEAFDSPSRSRALFQLAMLLRLKLLDQDEIGAFRPETKEAVQAMFGK